MLVKKKYFKNIKLKSLLILISFFVSSFYVANAQSSSTPRGFENWSELSKVAYLGDLNQVKKLVKQGSDPNKTKGFNPIPLDAAVKGNQYDVVVYLLPLTDKNLIKGCYYFAIHTGSEKIFSKLVASQGEPSWSFLADTAAQLNRAGHLEIIFNKVPATELKKIKGHALLGAAKKYNLSLSKRLIQEGALLKVSNYGVDTTPLLELSPTYTSQYTLKDNNTPYKERDDLLRLVLDAGVDVNAVDEDGYSALYRFVNRAYVIPVKMLLEKGADPNLVAKDGETALTNALRLELVTIPTLLIDAGSKVNVRTKMGGTIAPKSTPLIIAALTGNLPLVKLLVEKGSKINAKDKFRRTAYIWAKYRKHNEVAKFLLKNGARRVKNISRYFNRRGK